MAVGDVDNDGRPDLFVTRWRTYVLYRNKGDGTFEDATEKFGLGGVRDWPTSAAFADFDRDGDLDLYVCHYIDFNASDEASTGLGPAELSTVSYTPLRYRAVPDRLFRNDGGRFVDVTAEAGIVDRDGRGLGVVVCDIDGDGLVDIFVANDMTANFLYRNKGGLEIRGESDWNRESGQTRRGVIRPGWASPAETSTEMASPTSRSPTFTAKGRASS